MHDAMQPLKTVLLAARYSPVAAVVHQGTFDASTGPLFCNLDDEIWEDHEVAVSQTDILVGKNATSREVIVSPAMNLEALDMGPMHQNINSSKDCAAAQV